MQVGFLPMCLCRGAHIRRVYISGVNERGSMQYGELYKGDYARGFMQGGLCKAVYARGFVQGGLCKGVYAGGICKGVYARGLYNGVNTRIYI